MPIYEYRCKNGHVSDHLVSYNNRKETQECPECKEPAEYALTFCTNIQYGLDYSTYHADTHKWNLRENKRHGTKGKSYA